MGYQSGSCKTICPFCKKAEITAFHKPSFAQASRSSISSGAKYTYARKEEQYFIAGDCPNCGAKEKDIEKKMNLGDEDKKMTPEEHKKRLERFKAMGLPTKIVRKRE